MWEFIEANKRKTTVLLILMTLFLILAGIMTGIFLTESIDIGALVGLAIGLISTVSTIFYAKFNASKFFLKEADAVEVKKGELPVLENIVEEMSIASALGFVPKIYIVNSPYPNAFAVGINKNNASVAVTTSLLTLLNRDELAGVIAHEMAHIKNQDTLYLMYAGVIFGIIVSVSDALLRSASRPRRSSKNNGDGIILLIIILFAILSPIMIRLLYFSLSRKREFLADASACQFTRFPTGLASALYKISNYSLTGEKHDSDGSSEIIRCMYIHNRLQGAESFFSNLFATHPPVEKRIAVLKKMGASDIGEYNKVYSTVVSKKQLIPKRILSKMNIAPIALAEASLQSEDKRIKRQRAIKNAYYDSKNYKIIKCDCETILKIPPELKIETITCPHCKKAHALKDA